MIKELKTPLTDFIIGSEWIYYKIYTGPKSADNILINTIYPLIESLYKRKVILKWFFIRYSDPDYHIRIRFLLNSLDDFNSVIKEVHDSVKELYLNGIVDNIILDTYKPEYKRYGGITMKYVESVFGAESNMILAYLSYEKKETLKNYESRWLFGIKAIDHHLDLFGYSNQDKTNLLYFLKESYKNEFKGSIFNIGKQLGTKSRIHKEKVQQVINSSFAANFLEIKKKQAQKPISDIVHLKNRNDLEMSLNELNLSLLHMLINRLFKSRNRLYELVLYDLLYSYYFAMTKKNVGH
ncbi:thiopeptide-type bacteriocin biosynthesis protein [Flagellimonas onchidii]|uniref:thiopeptide-type bacteriocin biosynthesis protein n=1 Tax=Flagellimonas onchidii TaxID=2562684 RepID=UPI0010A5E889|nr:thiopeptide-type bacteriocin biosynthesis protein [Allomuricauda onchidii]